MATVLFAWELGGALGHLMVISPIAKALAASGHRMVVAAKDIASARRVLGEKIELLPTPRSDIPLVFPQQQTYAHLLANVGFGDDSILESHNAAWKTIYDLVRPNLIILNFSPVALLAARGVPARRATLGPGFFVPPDVDPLPAFRPDQTLDWKEIDKVEAGLLARVNNLLKRWRQPPLARLGQLFSQVDQIFLLAYPELDHFPNRGSAEYFGTVNDGIVGGIDPVWPEGPGRKIFVYVRNFPNFPQLLQALNDSSQPTLIYAGALDAAIRDRFTSRTLRFATDRLNMEKVAEACDVAVTYGGFTSTATVLRAGKPVLVVPFTEEQGIVARMVHQQHGAGLGAFSDQPQMFASRLKLVLEDPRYAAAAGRLAEKLKRIDLAEKHREIVRRIQAMLI
jgi:hypothetical protein